MTEVVREGGCQCGAVRFRTRAEPVRVLACHCQTCKQRTGGPYGIGVYFNDSDVEFLQGEMKTFEFHSVASGRWLRNEFCSACGCTVTWTLEMRPGARGMAVGNFDDADAFTVTAHVWTESARSDMRYPDTVDVHEQALPPA